MERKITVAESENIVGHDGNDQDIELHAAEPTRYSRVYDRPTYQEQNQGSARHSRSFYDFCCSFFQEVDHQQSNSKSEGCKQHRLQLITPLLARPFLHPVFQS